MYGDLVTDYKLLHVLICNLNVIVLDKSKGHCPVPSLIYIVDIHLADDLAFSQSSRILVLSRFSFSDQRVVSLVN